MKNILSGLFLFALTSLQAQNVTDFKYVIVPQKFVDFAKEDYQLNSALKIALKKKGYEIVNENSVPLDIQINPCLASKANIENNSTNFKNKLIVTFSDCNNTTINSFEGSSKDKDFSKGYQESLSIAMNQVGKQNAKDLPLTKLEKNETSKTPEIVQNNSGNTENSTNVYKLGGKNYITANTNNNEFVLIDKDNSKVVAQFYPASQQNVYHVTVISLNGSYQTIGYVNGNTIIIEYKTGDKSWISTTYTK